MPAAEVSVGPVVMRNRCPGPQELPAEAEAEVKLVARQVSKATVVLVVLVSNGICLMVLAEAEAEAALITVELLRVMVVVADFMVAEVAEVETIVLPMAVQEPARKASS